jgi:hypothetical protein
MNIVFYGRWTELKEGTFFKISNRGADPHMWPKIATFVSFYGKFSFLRHITIVRAV